MPKRALTVVAILLASFCAAAPASGQRTLVASLRQPPATLSEAILREANRIIWQRLAASLGPGGISEYQVAGQMQGGACHSVRAEPRGNETETAKSRVTFHRFGLRTRWNKI